MKNDLDIWWERALMEDCNKITALNRAMAMRLSAKGYEFITRHEGIRLRAYRDSRGIWTIGIGHTAAAGSPFPEAGMILTALQVHNIFLSDISDIEKQVIKAFEEKPIPQNVFDGSVSFGFNTGHIETASWVPLYLAGEMQDAQKHFMFWNKPPEIAARREAERDLIFNGNYGE